MLPKKGGKPMLNNNSDHRQERTYNPPNNYPTIYVANTSDNSVDIIGENVVYVGSGPIAMIQVKTQHGQYVYVASIDGQVYVIDTSDHSIVVKISLPGKLTFHDNRNMMLSPDGKYVYIAYQGTEQGKVTLINTSDHNIEKTITLSKSNNPIAMAFVANKNKLYVLCSGTIAVIDTEVIDEINTIELAHGGPEYLAVTPNQSHFIVGYADNSRIQLGNVEDDTLILIRKIGSRIRSIAVSSDNKYVYVGCKNKKYKGGFFHILKISDLSEVERIHILLPKHKSYFGNPVRIVEIKRENENWDIYVGLTGELNSKAHVEGCIHRITRRGDTFKAMDRLEVRGYTGYLALSKDNKHMVAVSAKLNTISYIDLDEFAVKATYETGDNPSVVLLIDE